MPVVSTIAAWKKEKKTNPVFKDSKFRHYIHMYKLFYIHLLIIFKTSNYDYSNVQVSKITYNGGEITFTMTPWPLLAPQRVYECRVLQTVACKNMLTRHVHV